MPDYFEARLDRIARLTEENAKAIGLLTEEMRAGFGMVSEALKEMAEAQSAMLHSQENLNKTLDRLAQLWGQSPN